MILVAGALHWDVIVRAPRMPGKDETVQGQSVDYALGGKGANQAMAAARMGAQVALAGRVGDDAPGGQMRAALAAAGVDVRALQRDSGPSGMSVAIVEPQGDYGAVIVSAANLGLDPDAVAWPDQVSHLILQNEIPPAVNLALARRARAAGAKVILNAAPARKPEPELLPLVDLLVVNRVEAAQLLGRRSISPSVRHARALVALGVPAAIVTLGADGLILVADGALTMPAHRVTPISTHGAGDAFIGALAVELAMGQSLVQACRFAQAAAALYVSTAVGERAAITAGAVRNLAQRDGQIAHLTGRPA